MKSTRSKTILYSALVPLLLLCAAMSVSLAKVSDASAAEPSDGFFSICFHSAVGDFVYEDRPIEPTDYLVADEIFTRRINAPLSEKRALMTRAVRAGADYERAVTLCMPKVKEMVDRAEKALYLPPQDAEATFYPNSRPPFRIRKEKSGRKLEREKTFELIYAAVRSGQSGNLSLPTSEIAPSVTAAALAENTHLKADFDTRYAETNEDREHNIALALSKINGMKIESGEEFSFNKAVGARTQSGGFRQAKIIIDGDYVLGYGGGVCQASTTLYNAALRAGMEITSVRSHSLSAGYVPPSLDAMVNSGSSDLRFKNPLPTPVYIAASASGGVARVRIYGEKNEFTIIPRSVVISRTPPPDEETVLDTEHKYLPEGAESGERLTVRYGKEGIKSEAYLEYYKDGRFVRREKIRSDSYKSLRGMSAVAP